jgi:hypothetical protein
MLTARADDGFANAQGPFIEGTAPGAYRFNRSTLPPMFLGQR